jgi:hypothetical protein
VDSGTALQSMCKSLLEQSNKFPNANWELVWLCGLGQEIEILSFQDCRKRARKNRILAKYLQRLLSRQKKEPSE